ncbi:MAG: 30S ribosomal protein S8 [Candidatus Eisenbacteria bacterium]|nr:30S ribosomal protein S8 [Candidatus Eisenbacteria bacterium]
MSVSDPIADFLTRIRNAARVRHERVDVPASRMREEITRLLVREGYLADYKRVEDGRQGVLRIFLRYDREDGSSVIEGIQRVSTPGRRVYVRKHEIPRVRGGLGTAILSTPSGVMSDKEARQQGLGGELLARVW